MYLFHKWPTNLNKQFENLNWSIIIIIFFNFTGEYWENFSNLGSFAITKPLALILNMSIVSYNTLVPSLCRILRPPDIYLWEDRRLVTDCEIVSQSFMLLNSWSLYSYLLITTRKATSTNDNSIILQKICSDFIF